MGESALKDRPATIGWALDRSQRQELLGRFPPAYTNVVADHVTLQPRAKAGVPLPADTAGELIGRVDDGHGVEELVVRIGGTTDRPGGGTYHITWSLGAGHRAKESNDAIGKLGWTPLPQVVPVTLQPTRFLY